ncbi:hypothetical protein EVAR_80120_1 [Eumeta japonica]|uniref:Uncharacterized protein n=1 Tax=Eumeta variegata TaxID=151549 RepID=A0A4C1UDR7_EUMVA|nr:hypothetical protein EVAR_80120_1 [Eumeta japonica]
MEGSGGGWKKKRRKCRRIEESSPRPGPADGGRASSSACEIFNYPLSNDPILMNAIAGRWAATSTWVKAGLYHCGRQFAISKRGDYGKTPSTMATPNKRLRGTDGFAASDYGRDHKNSLLQNAKNPSKTSSLQKRR